MMSSKIDTVSEIFIRHPKNTDRWFNLWILGPEMISGLSGLF